MFIQTAFLSTLFGDLALIIGKGESGKPAGAELLSGGNPPAGFTPPAGAELFNGGRPACLAPVGAELFNGGNPPPDG